MKRTIPVEYFQEKGNTLIPYPLDSMVCFQQVPVNTYQMDSDLSGGYCYPAFEQPGFERSRQIYRMFLHAMDIFIGSVSIV